MQSPINITSLLKTALAEDVGSGDITSNATIPAEMQTQFAMNARADMVVCGLACLPELFAMVDARVVVDIRVGEGARVAAGTTLAILSGPARALLVGERVALNLVQQLSGVATLTAQYVDAVAGTQAKILDTRKTVLGMRVAQKYAVRCGGGSNHRMGLYDAVLIKDNHIAVAGGVRAAVLAARNYLQTVTPSNDGAHLITKEQVDPVIRRGDKPIGIEVECDTLAQLDEALTAGVDSVLLDNMSNAQLTEAVANVRAHNAAKGQAVKTEASGNVSLATVRGIALTGVDAISVGKLTHSAVAVDIGLDEV
jgi:nicotinate-nucleotide pyrophosphorylase (carboxylating)